MLISFISPEEKAAAGVLATCLPAAANLRNPVEGHADDSAALATKEAEA